VPTFGSKAVLVTSSNQPDALAYGVVKAVFDNLADFKRLHPALATLEIRQMVPSEAVMPIHPGALRYFREAGLVP
jgi:TRAP transporter TAXI family solute receptor